MAIENKQLPTVKDSGFDLNNVFAEIAIWIGLIRRNLKWYIIVGVVGGGLGILFATLPKPKYRANTKFMMRADASGMASQLSSLNSLLGTGTSPTGTPLERIAELIGSEKVVLNALFSKAIVNNKEDLLINHYIELQELRKKWKKDTVLSRVSFTEADRFDQFSFAQRKVFKNIYGAMVGKNMTNGVLGRSFDKKSAMVSISATYINEEFSICMCKAVYNELVDFYINEAVASTRRNVKILTIKADSIKNELDQARQAFAQNTDKTLGILLSQNRVQNKSLSVRENMLTLMYGEILKNLETLRFIEQSTTPSFSVIDEPFSPIEPMGRSRILFGLAGSVIPLFLLLLASRGWVYIKTLDLDFDILKGKNL